VDGDVLLEAECERVRGEIGIGAVVRQLEARNYYEPVLLESTFRLGTDLGDVRRPRPGIDGARHRVGEAHAVIGDAEHVEVVPAVEINELPERELAVAPRGVCMKLAEQEAVHHLEVLSNPTGPGRRSWADPGSNR